MHDQMNVLVLVYCAVLAIGIRYINKILRISRSNQNITLLLNGPLQNMSQMPFKNSTSSQGKTATSKENCFAERSLQSFSLDDGETTKNAYSNMERYAPLVLRCGREKC